MIASLPMYDWQELRAATDAWWNGLRKHLGSGPDLARRADHAALWSDPQLLFSQTCGYPFTHAFKGRLKLVATPHYGADGCEGPDYCSIVFAREPVPPAALRGARAAVNNPDSMSGMLALQLVFAAHAERGEFFGQVIETGSHVASLAAVRDGLADVCAIDAVCVALAKRWRPSLLAGLVEIARSPHAPGLPYVTIAGDVPRLRQALAAAFADPELAEARRALLLTGFSLLTEADYQRIPALEADMQRAGGLKLFG
jgi:ABC-type phosphate/phosphonate transport system substrate-binding protein